MKHSFQYSADAIRNAEKQTGKKFDLTPCPHCAHPAYLADPQKDPDVWGGYRWQIICSSSHCRASVSIVADGWFEKLDGALNKHIPSSQLYRDRVTDLRAMWNRRAGANAKLMTALEPFARAAGFHCIEAQADDSLQVLVKVAPGLSGALTVKDFRRAREAHSIGSEEA